jgi:type 1 glutamine amidotransferase
MSWNVRGRRAPLIKETAMKRWMLGACALAVAAAAVFALAHGDAAAQAKSKRKLLLYTLTKGFHHSSTEILEQELPKLGKESGAFECTVTKNPDDFTADNLKQYDAVFFFTTQDVLPKPEQRTLLIEYVKSGKGFIGAHNATDSLYNFPEYGDMIGGYFDGHPWNQEATFKVEDPTHPSTKLLPASFKFKEEVYQYKSWSRDNVHVLISLDNSSVDINKGKRPDKDYGVVWCKEYGKGRVFFSGFGHHDDCFRDEMMMKKHLLPGIQWAMGDVKWAMPKKKAGAK